MDTPISTLSMQKNSNLGGSNLSVINHAIIQSLHTNLDFIIINFDCVMSASWQDHVTQFEIQEHLMSLLSLTDNRKIKRFSYQKYKRRNFKKHSFWPLNVLNVNNEFAVRQYHLINT